MLNEKRVCCIPIIIIIIGIAIIFDSKFIKINEKSNRVDKIRNFVNEQKQNG